MPLFFYIATLFGLIVVFGHWLVGEFELWQCWILFMVYMIFVLILTVHIEPH